MSQKYICDRCDAVIKHASDAMDLDTTDYNLFGRKQHLHYDLCLDCQKEFKKFMDGAEFKEDIQEEEQ